jgi:hypothetical protein
MRRTGSEEPATEEGVDLSGGEKADATAGGGPDVHDGEEPALKDAATAQVRADKLRADRASAD